MSSFPNNCVGKTSDLSALKDTGSPTKTFGDDCYNIITALKTNNMFIAIQIATNNKGA